MFLVGFDLGFVLVIIGWCCGGAGVGLTLAIGWWCVYLITING